MSQRVTPQLVYDTRDRPLAAGVRSVGGPARRLLFAFDDTELVIQMTPERSPERIRLMGQVLDNGRPIGGASVQLNGPTGPRLKTTDSTRRQLLLLHPLRLLHQPRPSPPPPVDPRIRIGPAP